MQGEELRAIRKNVGMTLEQFGTALGMTGKFVGMMERGEAAIEKRTELAARWFEMGNHEPLRVGVAPFGDNYVVVVTEAMAGQPGRVTRVLPPGFASRDEAEAVARGFAETHGCPFIAA